MMDDARPQRRSGASRRNRRIAETRAELAKRFPNCIAAPKGAKQPLAIGIDREIIKRCADLSPWRIKEAIVDYVTGPTYLIAVLQQDHRVGLDGAVVGGVSPEQRAHARGLLKKKWPDWAAKLENCNG